MDYYCLSKFTDLQVHVQSRLLYNCEKAYPERITTEWLEKNPGRLFHTDTMLADRNLMLENKMCEACHYGCYRYEEQGLESRRSIWGRPKNVKKILDPHAQLQTLVIMLSTDCNLACVYCSPEFSTRWQRELDKDGEYKLDEHTIKNNNWTTLWSKMKQKTRSSESRFLKLLFREIILAKGLRKISLLGGEPLLNNQLPELIQKSCNKVIEVTTGLGVTADRLEGIIKKIKGIDVRFMISAESTGKNFEFIRYGSSWKEFQERTDTLKNFNYNIRFVSTITNLCLFDFHNFYKKYASEHQIILNPISMKPFLSPHVMDDLSKETCQNEIDHIDDPLHRDILSKMILPKPSNKDRNMLGSYLGQLSKRRGVALDFLPEHFLRWCGVN